MFVESLVQGSMTVQVRLSACRVVVGGGSRRRGKEGEEKVNGREGKGSTLYLQLTFPLQEAKGLMTYICR